MLMGVFIAERRFVHKIGNAGKCECSNFERPFFYVKVILLPMYIHFFNNFVAGSLAHNSPSWVILMLSVNFAHMCVWYVYLRVYFLRLEHVPRVNVRRLQVLGWIPTACNSCCCYCCASDDSGTRRRLASIYEMQRRPTFLNNGVVVGGLTVGDAADQALAGNSTSDVNPLVVELVVPEGAVVGSVLEVPHPSVVGGGKPTLFQVVVPEGAKVGSTLRFNLAAEGGV